MPPISRQPRRFGDDAYRLLPGRWRDKDTLPRPIAHGGATETLKFHARLLRAFGGAYDEILAALKGVLDWLDPAACPADMLPYLSRNRGWPLDPALTASTRKLIVRHVYELVYRRRGDLAAIAEAVEAFTGLRCECWTYHGGPGNFRWTSSIQLSAELGPDPARGSGSRITVRLTPLQQASGLAIADLIADGDRVLLRRGCRSEATAIAGLDGAEAILSPALLGSYPAGTRLLPEPAAGAAADQARGWSRRWGIGGREPILDWDDADSASGWENRRWGFAGQRGISPADRALRFTFVLEFDETPTDAQLRIINALAEYMRPARDHFSLRYPEDISIGFWRWGMRWASAAWGA